MPPTRAVIRVDVESEPMKVRIAENESLFRSAKRKDRAGGVVHELPGTDGAFRLRCPAASHHGEKMVP